MIETVAVVGIGSMGAPMARRLHAAGLKLIVCDRNEDALASFAKLGATVTRRPADCCCADLIIIMVATPEQMLEVAVGDQGLKQGLHQGATPLVAVMSTVRPQAIHALHEALAPCGIRVIDAPVSGGVVGAENGTLTIMLGGDRADVETGRPAFAAIGSRLFHCGALGSGQAIKIVNNIIGIANLVITAEAYQLAIDQGIALDQVAGILDVSTGRNFLSASPDMAPASYAAWARTPRDFASLLSIMRKDIDIALGLAAETGGTSPATEGLRNTLASLGADTYENWARLGRLHSLSTNQISAS